MADSKAVETESSLFVPPLSSPSKMRLDEPSLEDDSSSADNSMKQPRLPDRSLLDDDEEDDESPQKESQHINNSKDSHAQSTETTLLVCTAGKSSETPLSLMSTLAVTNFQTSEKQALQSIRETTTLHTWDGFVRQGTRLKTFLDDTMTKVRDSLSEKRPLVPQEKSEDEPPRQRRRVDEHAADLAREKMAEVMQLQRVRSTGVCKQRTFWQSQPHSFVPSFLFVMFIEWTATERRASAGHHIESGQRDSP